MINKKPEFLKIISYKIFLHHMKLKMYYFYSKRGRKLEKDKTIIFFFYVTSEYYKKEIFLITLLFSEILSN